jgi:hypothetical protein
VRVSRISQQLRALIAQSYDLGDSLLVVVGIAVIAPVDERAPDFLAQPAMGGVREKRLDTRARVEDRPAAAVTVRAGGFRRADRNESGKPARSASDSIRT